MPAPDVSVVVVSWNTRDLTLACLSAIDADAAESGVPIEIVLVDNASLDGTAEAVREDWPLVTVVETPRNVGFAAGANLGIGRTSGGVVLLLNPDAVVPAGALVALLRFFESAPRAGVVGCKMVGPDGADQFSCGRFLSPFNQFAETIGLGLAPSLRRSYSAAELAAEAVDVDWVVGASMAIRRETLADVGDLDERFFMYSEDEDFCLRARRAGWTVHLLSSIRVVHVGGAAAAQALDAMRAAARASQYAFVRKHEGLARAVMFRALMALARLKPRRRDSVVGWGR